MTSTPGTYPSTTLISFSNVNTVFGPFGSPMPLDGKFRLAPGTYSPATPVIPTTPGVPGGPFPMDILHGRNKGGFPAPFITTFTNPNPPTPFSTTWTSPGTGNIKVLCVGGGGGAGGGQSDGGAGGGGVIYNASVPVTSGTVYQITVGGGGRAGNNTTPLPVQGTEGGPSSFSTLVIAGGGGGSNTGKIQLILQLILKEIKQVFHPEVAEVEVHQGGLIRLSPGPVAHPVFPVGLVYNRHNLLLQLLFEVQEVEVQEVLGKGQTPGEGVDQEFLFQ